MRSIIRRTFLSGALALGAGCGAVGGGGPSANAADEMSLGAADAPVTLIEYASCTCPVCAHFHEEVWAQLKANYIDTGKVRFIYREMPAHEPQVALAGFQVARCGGATTEQYFARLDAIYRQQQALFASGTAAGARDVLIGIGAASGLSADQVNACIMDAAGAERVRRVVEGAREFNVTGTPTLILNGRKLESAAEFTYVGLSRAIDAELS